MINFTLHSMEFGRVLLGGQTVLTQVDTPGGILFQGINTLNLDPYIT